MSIHRFAIALIANIGIAGIYIPYCTNYHYHCNTDTARYQYWYCVNSRACMARHGREHRVRSPTANSKRRSSDITDSDTDADCGYIIIAY